MKYSCPARSSQAPNINYLSLSDHLDQWRRIVENRAQGQAEGIITGDAIIMENKREAFQVDQVKPGKNCIVLGVLEV